MRALLVCILVGALPSAAAPELKLPPSEHWELTVDDAPPAGDASMLTATHLAVLAVLGVALIGGIVAFALRKSA